MTRAAETGAGTLTDSGCVFCELKGRNEDLVLHRGRLCYVILNLYPYNNGHLMVVPNRHLAELASTTVQERAELMTLVRHAEMALDEAYRPDGINVGINLADRRRRHPGTSARAPGAAVERRHQLHGRHRGHPGAPGRSFATAARLRPVFERLSKEVD